MSDFLRSSRIVLRAPEPEDLGAFYQWENDSSLWKYSATISPFSAYALKTYIAQGGGDFYEQRQMRLVITDAQTQQCMGYVDLYDFDPFHRRAGVGVLVDPKFQRKGIAQESLRLLGNYALEFLGIHQLFAHVPLRNEASVRLFTSLAYCQAGVLKSWIRVGQVFEDVLIMQYLGS